ncbi:MAG: ASKHA domain-containing protein [Thermosediminibacteraceae bacterium]|nr:ASKHA domain-containing protein [Thermosediminibacteraceae bacterium]
MKKYTVTILPDNIQVPAEENASLKKVFTENGIKFEFPCGGMGKCKKCKVKVIKENSQEETLACQLKVAGDLVIELPKKEQKYEILAEGLERRVVLDPLVKKVYLKIPQPSLKDNRDDWKRLAGNLEIKPDLKILRELPEKLRESDFKVTLATSGDEILAVEKGDTSEKLLGMAFDIGTTTLAGYLLNLKTGRELARVSALNPQTNYGADVISRINLASESQEGLDKLYKEVVGEINKMIERAVDEAGYNREDVYAITVVGNTTMQHLFLKIQPKYLARAPYVPVVTEPIVVDAAELSIKINPAGKVFVLPNIAGFVGADTVSAALACEMDESDELTLLIDIGTNGEMVLGTKERLFACSTAAGPAFEGAHISCGMRGATGAIDHVKIDGGIEYTVIGGVKPVGICGSGLLDAVAELLKVGIIDKKGRIIKPEKISGLGQMYRERLKEINGFMAFVLEENTGTGQPVYVNQKDIRELQLAKGAIAAGIEILLEIFDAKVEDIKKVFLAGAFGNYLKPESACRVGLIPPELEGKIKPVGNAAGAGAKLALLSEKEYERAVMLSRKIQYIELSAVAKFSNVFAKKLEF